MTYPAKVFLVVSAVSLLPAATYRCRPVDPYAYLREFDPKEELTPTSHPTHAGVVNPTHWVRRFTFLRNIAAAREFLKPHAILIPDDFGGWQLELPNDDYAIFEPSDNTLEIWGKFSSARDKS